MKLLFDENLSYKLVGLLTDLFPDSVHVRCFESLDKMCGGRVVFDSHSFI